MSSVPLHPSLFVSTLPHIVINLIRKILDGYIILIVSQFEDNIKVYSFRIKDLF